MIHRPWEIASHTTSTSSTGVSERERKQPGKSGIEEIAVLLYWCNVHIERQLRFESGRPEVCLWPRKQAFGTSDEETKVPENFVDSTLKALLKLRTFYDFVLSSWQWNR